ncbi:MAG: hypothetical protein ACI87E_004220 [Mariniblastus sp.]|jgi:hypothetical protein
MSDLDVPGLATVGDSQMVLPKSCVSPATTVICRTALSRKISRFDANPNSKFWTNRWDIVAQELSQVDLFSYRPENAAP